MNRKQALTKLSSHPFCSKLFKKLTQNDLDLLIKFVSENEHLNKDDFAVKSSRWYLDDPNKPKNLNTMWAILSEIN